MKKYFAVLTIAMLFCATKADAQRPKSEAEQKKFVEVVQTQDRFESYSLDAGYEMVVTPLVASVKVMPGPGGKIEHRVFEGRNRSDGETGKVYKFRKMFVDAQGTLNFDFLKAQVVFDFCREAAADVIVMPQFSARYRTKKVTRMDVDGNRVDMEEPVVENGCYLIEVEMVGFPAIYTNFREATENDRWIKHMFNEGRMNNSDGDIHVYEDYDTTAKN